MVLEMVNKFPCFLLQSYCKIFEPPNVFAIIFAELVKIDKIYRPGRKTKSRGAEKLVFHLEKLSFLNCNCNCHHHGHRGICVSHIWAQAMTITITVQNSAPYFLRKRRKRNLLYIYLYIYIVLPILPLSPQNAPAENRTVIVIVIARAFFEVHNLRCTPQLSSEKKYRKTLANPE